MTVQSPNMYDGLGVSAIGHFSMRVDFNGGEYKFFDKPQWVNGCGCDKCDHIPLQYTIQKEFGFPTPPRGTWYDIWISVYWSCGNDSGNSRHCISEDIYYRDYIK
ncbi:hypothetical protein RhiirA4_411884 [Rhizophagus irregularis]|uniref:Uncharacterized protein n=1 Tax=Rhizophagus irregularis TaxID=588596 RepID=A0A2I1HG28_9GLOM|nr:hypothetical protein RhiirA4_411884 [Rhizophagus irregularis]